MTSTFAPAAIRTYTPLIVSAIVTWLASYGINLNDETTEALAVLIGAAVGGLWWTVVKLLEDRWPRLSLLLGSRQAPVAYAPADELADDAGTTEACEDLLGPDDDPFVEHQAAQERAAIGKSSETNEK